MSALDACRVKGAGDYDWRGNGIVCFLKNNMKEIQKNMRI